MSEKTESNPRGAGRKRGTRTGPQSDAHRDKIRNSNILRRLISHAEFDEDHENHVKLTGSQVKVGLALINKFLPDLKAVEVSGDEQNPIQHQHAIGEEVRGILGKLAARHESDADDS